MKKNNIDSLVFVNPHLEEIMKKQLIRYRKDCQKWAIEFTHPTHKGKRIRKTLDWDYAHKKEAQKEAENLWLSLKIKGDSPELWSDITLKIACVRYAKSRGKVSKTDRGFLDWFIEELGSKDIKHINLADIDRLIEICREKKRNKNSTINRKLDILKAVLNFSFDRNWIASVPKWKKLKESKRKGIYISQDMRVALIDAMEKTDNLHLKDPLLFAIATGLRKSNLINLKKENILDDIYGKKITLPDFQMKNGEHFSQYLTEYTHSFIKRNMNKHSLFIFNNCKVGLQGIGDFKKAWKTVRKAAELEHIVWHDLRHTCATEKGAYMSPAELKEFMGWKNIEMAQTYCHSDRERLLENQRKSEIEFGTDLARET